MKRKFTPMHFFLKIVFNSLVIVLLVYLIASNFPEIKEKTQDNPYIIALFFIPGLLVIFRQYLKKKRK